MAKNDLVKVEGIVEEALPGLLFRVNLIDHKDAEGNPKEVLAHMGGKMKMYRIRVVAGDRVAIEMPNLEDRRGRIIRRL